MVMLGQFVSEIVLVRCWPIESNLFSPSILLEMLPLKKSIDQGGLFINQQTIQVLIYNSFLPILLIVALFC